MASGFLQSAALWMALAQVDHGLAFTVAYINPDLIGRFGGADEVHS